MFIYSTPIRTVAYLGALVTTLLRHRNMNHNDVRLAANAYHSWLGSLHVYRRINNLPTGTLMYLVDPERYMEAARALENPNDKAYKAYFTRLLVDKEREFSIRS
jgi:hypothetical protein